MKTQYTNLNFRKNTLIELSDSQLETINGGGITDIHMSCISY